MYLLEWQEEGSPHSVVPKKDIINESDPSVGGTVQVKLIDGVFQATVVAHGKFSTSLYSGILI